MSAGNDAELPKLQLETAGGGPGSRVKTAVATGDHDFHIDRSVLPNAPWWFDILRSWKKISYSQLFCTLPLEVALSLLENAQIPPLYRLGLGLKWGFLDPVRDGFSHSDLAEIMREAELLLDDRLGPELEIIERRSTYQIWRKLRHELQSAVDEYWREHPILNM
jgi:hypothetical protein